MIKCEPMNSIDQIWLSIRDYFAAAALTTLMQSDRSEDEPFDEYRKCLAANAYLYADAMLAERAKGGRSDG